MRIRYLSVFLPLILFVSMFSAVSLESQPPVVTDTLYVGNGSWGPRRADPAVAYDTSSQELIFNVYDTLICFGKPVTNGFRQDWDVHEQYWEFSPSLATNVPTREDVTKTVNSADVNLNDPRDSTWNDGSRCVGWVDDNVTGNLGQGDALYLVESDGSYRTWYVQTFNANPLVTATLWRGRYVFHMRTSPVIDFVNETGSIVDIFNVSDAEYSFKRGLVQDQLDGPMWMYYRLFFDQKNSDFASSNVVEPTALSLAHLINNTIETSGNDLTINVGIPFPDMSFKQVLCQTYGSMVSKEFSVSIGCWDGDLFTLNMTTGYPLWWESVRRVSLSPYETAGYRYVGTGPYRVTVRDYQNKIVRLSRNVNYWRGWPASEIKSYLENVELRYVSNWTQRKNDFLSGDLDTCAVPTQNISELLDAYRNPISLQIETIKGIKDVLYSLIACFTFTLNPSSPMVGSGHFPDGIPLDFFNNTHVRKAFAYAFNHTEYIQERYSGEATWNPTPLISGLYPDYRASVQGYDANLALAEAELKKATFNGTSVWESGFTLETWYWPGAPLANVVNLLRDFFAQLNTYDGRPPEWPRFALSGIEWVYLMDPPTLEETPIWDAAAYSDFADADCSLRPYMHSNEDFSRIQNYSAFNGWGSRKDMLLDSAFKTADGPERAAMYAELQNIYVDDCPSFPIVQPVGRKFLQYWVKGWYYNAMYPSQYYYHMYKEDDCWGDVTGPYVGVPDGMGGNMRDIGYVAGHFGAKAPDPSGTPPYDPKWAPGSYGCGGCDVYGDRRVDMRDIGFDCAHFLHYMQP